MTDASSEDRFYSDLDAFDRFDDFVDFGAYTPVPDDWVVVLSDVRGSTDAIRSGRYKDVNMVGAASITAVLNVCGEIDVPYVFGGDGGTLVVPGTLAASAKAALQDLQSVSKSMFGLGLRVGAVPVADLRAKGSDLRVRKYTLSPGNHLAMFGGGGLELADALLKSAEPGNPYAFEELDTPHAPDLEGLSCRWEPLKPRNGRMLTLMVQGRGADEGAVLGEALTAISEILGHDINDAAPASGFSMKFKWPPKGLKLEARATAGERGYMRTYSWALFTSLMQLICERFDRKMGDYDGAVYREEIKTNTDFRKYDGVLRTVIDVSADQARAIEGYLEDAYFAGKLVYGLHLADTALMTCLVFSLGQSEHVHFIDGSDGGFAMAATGFKERAKGG